MLEILLVTVRPESLLPFLEDLSSDARVRLKVATSGAEALDVVRAGCPHLVVVDWGVPDTEPLDLVKEIISVNAMVNTAVVSPLSGEQFHDASEGLGILTHLPLMPGRSDAKELLQKLSNVLPVS